MTQAGPNRARRGGYCRVVADRAAPATDVAQVARAAAQHTDDLLISSELPTELIVRTSTGSAHARNRS
jgi:hypothetical protein